ncbi:MAG: DUF2442 domain-containing protein [Massilia sp.]
MNKPLARVLTFDEDTMWVHLVDGRTLGIPLAYFPRLLNAKPAQLARYVISGAGAGLHWEELDEDISVEHLLMGHGDRTVRPLAAG